VQLHSKLCQRPDDTKAPGVLITPKLGAVAGVLEDILDTIKRIYQRGVTSWPCIVVVVRFRVDGVP
jgi:hypothetical protein